MDVKTIKPRMVFFQWDHKGLPMFLKLHMQLHVKCLSQFFDVILINQDCDYKQICDTYQPELTLFESGFKSTISKKLNIINTSSNPEIPKLGLHNGDGWCESRVSFFSDMNRWGIDTFFSISTTFAEHIPEISGNLFVWPNFIDSEIYRDYGLEKIVPVMFNGSMISLYPWRQKIFNIVSKTYPSLTFAHSGYEKNSSLMIHGEKYARTINSSWFVPACGSIAHEVVRKHFEVPGSKSCLVAEKTPALEAAGFVDMKNCVFADEKDVLDKLNYLFQNKNELGNIILAGYELVHSRHTLNQRDQILQWFNLKKYQKHSEKIIQDNPFEPLSLAIESSNIKNTPFICGGFIVKLLRKGDEKLWAGKYDEAENLYLQCLNFIPWMSEPKLKLAITHLYKGNVEQAHQWIIEPIQNQLGTYKSSEPDPVEWAYFIICLICQGKLNEATIRANQFNSLYHPELDRTRWVINCLRNKEGSISFPVNPNSKKRRSIHQIPQRDFEEWVTNFYLILEACQQIKYVKRLNYFFSIKNGPIEKIKTGIKFNWLNNNLLSIRMFCIEQLNYIFEILQVPKRNTGLPSIYIKDFVIRLGKVVKIDSAKNLIIKHLSF